uniref:Putative secreted protein n=1 Tax=Anopheles darlingi TaxID=43151 RepID=A0A2M4D156_ANODA
MLYLLLTHLILSFTLSLSPTRSPVRRNPVALLATSHPFSTLLQPLWRRMGLLFFKTFCSSSSSVNPKVPQHSRIHE